MIRKQFSDLHVATRGTKAKLVLLCSVGVLQQTRGKASLFSYSWQFPPNREATKVTL